MNEFHAAEHLAARSSGAASPNARSDCASQRKGRQRPALLASLGLTLLLLSAVNTSWLLAIALPALWLSILAPLERREWAVCLLVAPFFIAQNYLALSAGAFMFSQRDFLLMPWYEPLLWMCWYVHTVRLIGQPAHQVPLRVTAWAGLVFTMLAFSVFGGNTIALTAATAVSCTVLIAMFHQRGDLAYACCAVTLGAFVEGVGVGCGLWTYPESEATIWGVPWWSLSMWISVGLLGRRFVVPAAEWLAARGARHV